MQSEHHDIVFSYTSQSLESNDEKIERDTEANKNSLACLGCKHNHRKCDRNLPKCTYCEQKGKTCVYEKRKKKVEKKRTKITFKDVTNRYIASLAPSSLDNELTREYTVCCHTDICLESMWGFIPVMPQEKVVSLLNYVRDISTRQKTTFTPRSEEVALIFALQCMVNNTHLPLATAFVRQGHVQIATHLHDKARKLLYDSFDNMDFEVAATYAYMGLFLLNRGKTQKSEFLLRNAKEYLDKCDSPFRHSLNVLVSGNLQQLQDVKNLSLSMKHGSDVLCPHDSEIYPLHPSIVDDRKTMLLGYMVNNVKGKIPENEYQIKFNTLFLMANGIKLQYARSRGNDTLMNLLEIANDITELASHKVYPMSSVWTTTSVVEAAMVQMDYFLQTGDKTLIERLKQDRHALRMMLNRDVMTLLMHAEVMERIDRFIEMHQEMENIDMKLRIKD